MTSISTQGPMVGSATIHQFPVGGRAGLTISRDRSNQIIPFAGNEFVLTDAWYHQEAIRESEQATKQ